MSLQGQWISLTHESDWTHLQGVVLHHTPCFIGPTQRLVALLLTAPINSNLRFWYAIRMIEAGPTLIIIFKLISCSVLNCTLWSNFTYKCIQWAFCPAFLVRWHGKSQLVPQGNFLNEFFWSPLKHIYIQQLFWIEKCTFLNNKFCTSKSETSDSRNDMLRIFLRNSNCSNILLLYSHISCQFPDFIFFACQLYEKKKNLLPKTLDR